MVMEGFSPTAGQESQGRGSSGGQDAGGDPIRPSNKGWLAEELKIEKEKYDGRQVGQG